MAASDVPGWIQGYRFNNANLSGGEFAELSGLGDPITTRTGTPTIEIPAGTEEALLLDNTWHGGFMPPNQGQGTCGVAIRVTSLDASTQKRYPIIYSGDGLSGDARRMVVSYFSGSTSVYTTSISSVNTPIATISSGVNRIGMSMRQSNRKLSTILNAGSISATSPQSDDINGLKMAVGSAQGVILGAITGSSANTTLEASLDIHLYELHYFDGFPMDNHATELATFFAELGTTYN